jgi:hypothetical protein
MGYLITCWRKGSNANARTMMRAPIEANEINLGLESSGNEPNTPRLASSNILKGIIVVYIEKRKRKGELLVCLACLRILSN